MVEYNTLRSLVTTLKGFPNSFEHSYCTNITCTSPWDKKIFRLATTEAVQIGIEQLTGRTRSISNLDLEILNTNTLHTFWHNRWFAGLTIRYYYVTFSDQSLPICIRYHSIFRFMATSWVMITKFLFFFNPTTISIFSLFLSRYKEKTASSPKINSQRKDVIQQWSLRYHIPN